MKVLDGAERHVESLLERLSGIQFKLNNPEKYNLSNAEKQTLQAKANTIIKTMSKMQNKRLKKLKYES